MDLKGSKRLVLISYRTTVVRLGNGTVVSSGDQINV